jgi:hypothetical protein
MSVMGFQMWEPYRQSLMAEHRFYIEQAQERLLSQFGNIEAEADKAAQAHLEHTAQYFDPDKHDPADCYETANDAGIEFYQLLSDMHDATRLSVVAGMFHQWDKKLRDWLLMEIKHWHQGSKATQAIWKMNFPDCIDLLAALGFDVKSHAFYEHLDAMRLVVNVFKHGNGASLNELREKFPEFIPDPLQGIFKDWTPTDLTDHTDLKVTDRHIGQFSDAILEFWTLVPGQMSLADEVCFPAWFEKAILKDLDYIDANGGRSSILRSVSGNAEGKS